MLIVPEQYSFESEKRLLDLLGPTNQEGLEILYTFTSLSREVLAKYRGNRKPAPPAPAKDVCMSIALRELADRLEIFADCADNPNEVRELTDITEELTLSGIDGDALLSAAGGSGDTRLFDKARELTLISGAYRAVIEENYSDSRFDLSETADVIEQHRLFKETTVFIDEFYGFTYPELTVIGSLLKNASDVYVTAVCDGIGCRAQTDALYFGAKTAAELLAEANRSGVPAAEPEIIRRENRYNSGAVAAVEESLFSTDASDAYTGSDSATVTVISARTPYEECMYIASEAKRLVREEGLRYRDIAVVERGSQYSDYIPFTFAKYDIPVFRDRRRPLMSNPLIRYACSATDLAANGVKTDGIFTLLKTGLTGIPEEDIAELENYVYVWQTESRGWTKPFTRSPSGLGAVLTESDKEKLLRLNAVRESILNGIYSLRSGLKDADGEGCCSAVYQFLIDSGTPAALLEYARALPAEDALAAKRSWDIFMETLTVLADAVGGRRLSPAAFSSLLNIICGGADTGEMPSGLDEISVGSADRVRFTDKKVVFIAGANEGVFPAGAGNSFVLTRAERRELQKAGANLRSDARETGSRERFLFYAAAAKPSDRLYVSYSRSDFSSPEKQPSDAVAQIRSIVPGCRFVDTALRPTTDRIESRRSAMLAAAETIGDNTTESKTLSDYILTGPDASVYGMLLNTFVKPPLRFSDPALADRLFDSVSYISPTRVEKYYDCAFAYFCRYGMRAYPLEPAAFDGRLNGNLIHAALEAIIRECGREGLLTLSDEQIRSAAREHIENYAKDRIGSGAELDARTAYSLEQAVKTVAKMTVSIRDEMAKSGFRPDSAELKIGVGGEIPPYVLTLPDGSRVAVGGTADRVDTLIADNRTYLRVMDYKTGGRKLDLKDVFSGINLQMPIYLYGLCANGVGRYGNPSPAGVFYVPGGVTKPTLSRNADDEAVRQELLNQNRFSGMMVAYDTVLDSLGVEKRDKIDTTGDVKTDSISAVCLLPDRYDKLRDVVNGRIINMAQSLKQGEIDIEPLIDAGKHDACKYCDYKSVCRRENDDRLRRLYDGDPLAELS